MLGGDTYSLQPYKRRKNMKENMKDVSVNKKQQWKKPEVKEIYIADATKNVMTGTVVDTAIMFQS